MPRCHPTLTALAVLLITAVAALTISAVPARGQNVVGMASLRQLTRDADAVVRARIVAATAEIEAGGHVYPIVHAEVLATLKGSAAPGAIAFANVGSGTARYVDGEEVLLFLRHIDRVAELAATMLQARLLYVAIPNAGEVIVLTDAIRPAMTDAVRRYAALESIPDPETRGDALRALSLDLMKSGEPILVTSVLRDLAPGRRCRRSHPRRPSRHGPTDRELQGPDRDPYCGGRRARASRPDLRSGTLGAPPPHLPRERSPRRDPRRR